MYQRENLNEKCVKKENEMWNRGRGILSPKSVNYFLAKVQP